MGSGGAEAWTGYGKPPWIFKGSALYQLHLVKAEKARACIPKEFRLVEFLGYTLGGFFLASYENSPAGVFDELVVIAGIVWNRPTSCAWATRVYVNSDSACDHGRKVVGLPSQMARFSKRSRAISKQGKGRSGFLNTIGIGGWMCDAREEQDVEVTDIKCREGSDMCNISLTSAVPSLSIEQWVGPSIRMSLPSFSGGTKYNPNLLKYSCQIECRVRAVQPLKVSEAIPTTNDDRQESQIEDEAIHHVAANLKRGTDSFSTCIMLSKPIFALKFSEMKMQVEAPVVLSQTSNSLEPSVTVSAVP